MKRLVYIDTETTGLNPNKHGLREVAVIIEIDGVVKDKQLFKINPWTYRKNDEDNFVEIDEKALEISGLTVEDITQNKEYQNSTVQQVRLFDLLSKYSPGIEDDYDWTDDTKEDYRFQLVGYNVKFDIDFIKAWFKDENTFNFSNIFTHKSLDVFELVKHLKNFNLLDTQNEKLETVCKHFGIQINAHNAMDDIAATKELYELLQSKYIKAS